MSNGGATPGTDATASRAHAESLWADHRGPVPAGTLNVGSSSRSSSTYSPHGVEDFGKAFGQPFDALDRDARVAKTDTAGRAERAAGNGAEASHVDGRVDDRVVILEAFGKACEEGDASQGQTVVA